MYTCTYMDIVYTVCIYSNIQVQYSVHVRETNQERYNSFKDTLVSHMMADPLHHLQSLDLGHHKLHVYMCACTCLHDRDLIKALCTTTYIHRMCSHAPYSVYVYISLVPRLSVQLHVHDCTECVVMHQTVYTCTCVVHISTCTWATLKCEVMAERMITRPSRKEIRINMLHVQLYMYVYMHTFVR